MGVSGFDTIGHIRAFFPKLSEPLLHTVDFKLTTGYVRAFFTRELKPFRMIICHGLRLPAGYVKAFFPREPKPGLIWYFIVM